MWVAQRSLAGAQSRSAFNRKEIVIEARSSPAGSHVPRNKGKLTGQKLPLKLPEMWAIRARLQMSSNIRELVMFNLAIDRRWLRNAQAANSPIAAQLQPLELRF